jgi:hypothetical protein
MQSDIIQFKTVKVGSQSIEMEIFHRELFGEFPKQFITPCVYKYKMF